VSDDKSIQGVKIAPWRDPKVLSRVYQISVLAFVVSLVWYLAGNTIENLTRQGVASGFGFWNHTAGFGINSTLIEYSESSTYGRVFFVGLLNTLLVSIIGIIIATLLGFTIGIARLSPNWLIARMATVYIETIRNIPLLLQIFFWYFGVLRALPSPSQSHSLFDAIFINIRGMQVPAPIPGEGFWALPFAAGLGILIWILLAWRARRQLELTGQTTSVHWIGFSVTIALTALVAMVMGIPLTWNVPELKGFNFKGGITIVPELVALVLALATYTAAFIAEIVRAGILSVDKGQKEAAQAIGLRPGQVLNLVVIPQALRVIIPPLTNQYLNLTKNSSLAAAIAYPDLVQVFAGTALNQIGQAVEVISITIGVYLTLSLSIAMLMNGYNRRMAFKGKT
jgi:general L-amino acid transport system permease protein